MGQSLIVGDSGGVRTIRLNRPAVRNAIDFPMALAIAEAINGLESDDRLRIGVFAGSDEYFSSGMDLKAFSTGERPFVPGFGASGVAEATITKPLIAAVEGYAIAGGFEIVLACDLVVASRGARFALPEVRRGLIASGGGLLRLPKRIPRGIAMELALTGDNISAERAYALGLVNQLVEPGRALETAQDLAHRIAQNAPLAVVASKRVINESSDWSTRDAFALQRPVAEHVIQSGDAQEGAMAFLENRLPVWKAQ